MSPNYSEQKENHTGEHRPKENRRDSLGRGILKNLRRNDENHTIDVMQLALRDHQQTGSSSNTGKKSYRRRVSFAPEVTLHKIEFVPPSSGPDQRQPKRRETIAFAPSSSHSSFNERQFPTQEIPEFQHSQETYSSDVEMEDDTHVHSSPNKFNGGPGFEIYSDNDSDNMSITQRFEDINDDKSMELTKPLGDIQQLFLQNPSNSVPFPLPEESQESTSSTTANNRPFGSITSIFDNDLEEHNTEEVEMDLTQPFAPGSLDTQVNGSNRSSLVPSVHSTHPSESSTQAITLQNTELNRNIQDQDLDTTQVHNMDIDEPHYDIADQTEVSMDITKLMSDASQATRTPKRASRSPEKRKSPTPLRPARSHTSETGSPMSSKRKSTLSDSATLNLRERINSLTPKKRRRTTIGNAENTQNMPTISLPSDFHPMPPISLLSDSQQSLPEEPKSSFTPLRTSKNYGQSRFNSSQSTLPQSFIESAPLAPSHDDDIEEEDIETEEYKPVSLNQFLADLSIEFFDNLDINEDFTISLTKADNQSTLSPVDFLKAKTSKIPWLELYSFSCSELQKNMAELKVLFDNLNKEFSEENPALVREYYQSTSLPEQKKLSDHLLFMKTLSDKEAEIYWHTWSYQLLEELDTRLILNLESLEQDSSKLDTKLEEIINLDKSMDEELGQLSTSIDKLTDQSNTLHASQNEDFMNTRKDLYEALQDLNSTKERLKTVKDQDVEVDSTIAQYKEVKEAVEKKTSMVKLHDMDPTARWKIALRSFTAIQSVSGIKFLKLEGSKVTASICKGLLEIQVDLQNPGGVNSRQYVLSPKLSTLCRTYVERFTSKTQGLELSQQLTQISHIVKSLNWLDDELYYLGLVSPVTVEINESLVIRIKEVNKEEGYKAFIEVTLTEEALFGSLQPVSITAKLSYGSVLGSDTVLQNWKSKAQENSWIQNFEKLVLIE